MPPDGRSLPIDVEALLPLNPRVFYILLALAEGERHGYAILKAIEAFTSGSVYLTPGTLYPLIHQLLVDGWIAELGQDPQDPRRRRYRLSPLGRRIAQAEVRRLDGLVRTARSFNLLVRSRV